MPKQKFQKLSVNLYRRGELRYETAYNARDAARIATKMAKKGWSVKVQPWNSLGTKRNIRMTCEPVTRGQKVAAACMIEPSFKRQIKMR
jgi:hypothetical protein